MAFLKYFLASILFSAAPLAPGENGWYPVEKEAKSEEVREREDDPSIWVLFIKELGSERFQISFPEDPSYRQTEEGDLEITSKKGPERFQLTVRERKGPFSLEEEKWAYEKFIESDKYIYHLKAQTSDEAMASQFFSSLTL